MKMYLLKLFLIALPNFQICSSLSSSSSSPITTSTTAASLQSSVTNLKKVLTKEYTSFFSPMYKEYYSDDVTFTDPLTSLSGVSSYEGNVDMLAGRTLMGSILFQDASITLHSVTGGEINQDKNTISDITTRWTLKVTAKVLPWKPTAQFTGISVYKVVPSSNKQGLQIIAQEDFWDSINIKPDSTGEYAQVSKSIGVQDFLNQLKPSGYKAPQSAPELPFILLRRGNGYQVRSYPSCTICSTTYTRRDIAFDTLGVFTRQLKPLSPALLNISEQNKVMSWPIAFAKPGEESPILKESSNNVHVTVIPSQIVAVRQYDDASVEQVVRKQNALLLEAIERDGLKCCDSTDNELNMAQYDAIYTLGERRNEVWVKLADEGNPWK